MFSVSEMCRKSCRVCLTSNEHYNNFNESFHPVLSATKPLTYLDCFVMVTRIDLDQDVHLPQICQECSADLRSCYSFIRRAQRADTKLRKTTKEQQHLLGSDKKDEKNVVSEQPTNISNTFVPPHKNNNDLDMIDRLHGPSTDSSTIVSVPLLPNTSSENLDCYKVPKSKIQESSSTIEHQPTVETECSYLDKNSNQHKVECKVCKRSFPQSKYSTHFRKVHADAPEGFQCPKCPKHFAYRYRLKSHFEVHHGIRQKNVACSVCPKMFYSKKLLSTHLLSHQTTDINHKCELCGKGFQRMTGLRRHIIMHQGGREQCTECDKRFPNPAELRIHMLTHTKETQFLCAICGQGFRRQGPLTYHMRKHRGEKYSCIHCQQEFTCLSSMRRHEYKHTGLPFKCPRCASGQATRGSLERHMKETHQSELTATELRDIYSSVQNSRLQ